MPYPISPLKIYQLQYKPKHTCDHPLLRVQNLPPAASELMVKDKLDALLDEQYPEAQRLILISPKKGARECLLVNPEVAPDLKRSSPELPLPSLDSDLFIKRGFLKDEDLDKDIIQIEHENGNILKTNIEENLNPFVEITRNPLIEVVPHPKLKKRVTHPQRQSSIPARSMPKTQRRKTISELLTPKEASSSQKAKADNPSDSDNELMFDLEL